MDPLFDALEGRGNKRWNDTLNKINDRQNDMFVPMPGNPGGLGSSALNYMREMLSAKDMAMTHIDQDLRRALINNGAGDDKDWKCIGDKVSECEKIHFSGISLTLSQMGGFVDTELNVGKHRDSIRDDLKAAGLPSHLKR